MSRWKVNSATLLVLGVVAFLMVLILVLPDVDLPDFTFHRGTAPVVVHTRATASPDSSVVALAIPAYYDLTLAWTWRQPPEFRQTPEPNFRPILLRSLRC